MSMRALLEASRPLNAGMAASAVAVGALLAEPGALVLPGVWLAVLATTCSLAAGNLWNDAADAAEDALNRPERPLPSGRLTARAARQGAAGLSLVALAAALAAGASSFLLVAGCLGGLAWYAARGKQAGLAGNLLVALLAALAVGYGALSAAWADAAARPERALAPAALAGLLHLLRELVKDAQDREGDLAAGRRTWVIKVGDSALRRLLAQLAVLLLLPPLLSLLLTTGSPALRLAHLATLALPPYLLHLVLAARLEESGDLARLSRRFKAALGVGLALYLSAALA